MYFLTLPVCMQHAPRLFAALCVHLGCGNLDSANLDSANCLLSNNARFVGKCMGELAV